MRFRPMVRTSLRPSRLLATVFACVHLAAAATLHPLAMPLELKTGLVAIVAASLACALRRYAYLRARLSIVELQISDRERAAVRMREGDWVDAEILGTSCVTPLLTAINLRVQGFLVPKHVLLVRDNVNEHDFRGIRVLLRWARGTAADAAEAQS